MPTRTTSVDVFGAKLTRRELVKAGGALFVGFGLVGVAPVSSRAASAEPRKMRNSLDASLPGSWIEIHPDNTILIRTGKNDFGQGTTFTAYRQIVAEELSVPFEAITTVVAGDTDRTPDGSGAFDFLGRGTPNIRKAAAYTHQALLDLASRRLGVSRDRLTVENGVVSGGGKSVSYGALVQDERFDLTIPVSGDLTSLRGLSVTGDPPMKPVSEYTVIGQSYPNSIVASKVAAKTQWVTDVRLPGMLHARIVHPKTLGSKLVSAGKVDKKAFPTARVIVEGNLVGVVAASEWEAIRASQHVAAGTKWTDWKGLPGSENIFAHLRKADWDSTRTTRSTKSKQSEKSGGDAAASLAGSAKKLVATYEMPYLKHAPIGPTMAVADVRPDGTVFIHTHSQSPQMLRADIAKMLGTSPDNVVVRVYPGAGHYGRSNGGNAGAEDEAVILSRAVGKPVRVQWMRAEDFQWSTQSPAAFSDIEIGLDASGRITAYQADHYMPAQQDDRLVGAVLAGLPTIDTPDVNMVEGKIATTVNNSVDPWIYDGVPVLLERGRGTFQIGQKESPTAIGLRDHSLRTPGQFQMNFPRELALSEAAALAGVDAIQFRIDHAREDRVIGVLKAVREASGWDTRPSPAPAPDNARRTSGSTPVRGRGVAAVFRSGTHWACVCEISVVPESGVIKVEKYTIAVDPGIVVNPAQLKRQVEGGAVMGISHALLEETSFDESAVTARDWRTYPILEMADLPEIEVVLLHKPEVGAYGGGSEAANALAAPAIAAALYDATGKHVRRLPLRPDYVKSILGTA